MKQKVIIKNAQRTAKRMKKRKKEFSKDDLLHSKVSTVSLWKRILVVFVGLVFLGFSVWLYTKSNELLFPLAFGVFGIGIAITGMLAGKKRLDSILQGVDGGASNSIIDAIIDGIF